MPSFDLQIIHASTMNEEQIVVDLSDGRSFVISLEQILSLHLPSIKKRADDKY